MGKVKSHAPKLTKKFYPFVSVCTPTFNRRPFIPIMLECFRNQTYPKDRMEWIIVDDGTDKVKDLIDAAKIPQIKYFQPAKRMNLGEKRNYMHKQAKGTIIVYMDDDDYYPPERVAHAVERLTENKDALCAGSSEMYVYFKHIQKMIKCGPYGPNHATAGTFAFRASLLDQTQYEDHAALAEERAFLKEYTIPFVQLDPMKTILVFSHIHNTFDKKKLLENPHPDYLKESPKTVEQFIQGEKEAHIRKFFMEDIDALLAVYEPGEPKMKPEVLEQTKKIEEQRRQMVENHQKAQQSQNAILMKQEGKEPIPLTMQQIVELLQKQQNENDELRKKVEEQEEIIRQFQRIIIQPSVSGIPSAIQPASPSLAFPVKNKRDPEIHIDL
jgi:glycosyltransferase involved in cell wall biosynthesis